MTCNLVQIGTSKGVRLPASILKALEYPETFYLLFENNQIVLQPQKSRKNWAESFKEMSGNGDDKLLIDDNIDLDIL
ncbi:growth regulator [Thiovulum sp. ES]|nr:growth regulator [Thiovulum sp. ES]